MNVFLIPSWYPTRLDPVAGVFCREQALAIGDMRPAWHIAISLWGQGEHQIALRGLLTRPARWLDSLRPGRPSRVELRENVVEYRHPVPTWNDRLLVGNRRAVLGANRENLARALRELGTIDLLHAHVSYPGGWVALQLQRETRIPYVVTEHMSPFPFVQYRNPDGSPSSLIREPLASAAAILAVSPSLCERIRSLGLGTAEFVPNVVDEVFFRPSEADAGADEFLFFSLGRMVSQKGIPDLLRAIASFIQGLGEADRRRVKFRIGGGGPEAMPYREQASSLGLDGWIQWLGALSREQVREELWRCRCYVQPSRHETFGIVLAEATACGKPVISTRSGGPDFIVTPENGLLVDVERPDQLADALGRMFRTAASYDPQRIRDQFLARFSRPVVVDRIEQVYRAAAHRKFP